MERALASMPAGDSAARAELMANLAVERMTTSGDDHRGDALSADAVAMARRLGDPEVLARTLVLRYFATWRPAAQPDRVVLAEEYQQLVAANDLSPRLVALAAQLRWCAAAEVGDPVGTAAAMRDTIATTDRLRTPVLFATLTCSQASEHLMAGRFAEAEVAATEMFEALNGGRRHNARMLELSIRAQVRMETGRLAEVMADFQGEFAGSSYAGPFNWFMAWLLAEDGQLELADTVLHAFDEHLADDWVRPPMATAGLHVAAELGDRAFAARRIEELLAATGQIAYGGSGGLTIGPVDLALAQRLAAAGRRRRLGALPRRHARLRRPHVVRADPGSLPRLPLRGAPRPRRSRRGPGDHRPAGHGRRGPAPGPPRQLTIAARGSRSRLTLAAGLLALVACDRSAPTGRQRDASRPGGGWSHDHTT